MSKEDSSMIRVPNELKTQLVAYAMSVADQLDPKHFGENEVNNDFTPPLWRAIELLLSRDKAHRKRAKKAKGKKAARSRFTSEGGIVTGESSEGPIGRVGVYTDP